MLRAMECIQACGIPQRAVADAIGWSRTQISLTFRQGKFPVDIERFKAGLRMWAEQTPPVNVWLQKQGLDIEALFDRVGGECLDLDAELLAVGGRCATTGPRTNDVLHLVRVARYLLGELRNQIDGDERLSEIETAAGALLP